MHKYRGFAFVRYIDKRDAEVGGGAGGDGVMGTYDDGVAGLMMVVS